MLESMFGMFDFNDDGKLSAGELGVGYMAMHSVFDDSDIDDDEYGGYEGRRRNRDDDDDDYDRDWW